MSAHRFALLPLVLLALVAVAPAADSPTPDPAIIWGTFFGGAGSDLGLCVAADNVGSIYIAGNTESNDLPVTSGIHRTQFLGGKWGDAFVSKFAANGSLLWSTFLAGTAGEYARAIDVDSSGNVYVTGFTLSEDFPTSNGADQTFNGGPWGDVFLAKLSPDGNLVWATFHGGTGGERARALVVDPDGFAYVAGWTNSRDFPTLQPYDSTFNGGKTVGFGGDAFLAKFSPDGVPLWSTYLGGERDDAAMGIALDHQPAPLGHPSPGGTIYITGQTESDDFPTLNPFSDSSAGVTDAFVAAFNTDGELLWSTFLGGISGDWSAGAAVDRSGNAYVVGYTVSPDFPSPTGPPQHKGGTRDAFVAKFDPEGRLLWTSQFGGKASERANSIALDSRGSIYVTGETNSRDLPAVPESTRRPGGQYDAFLSVLDPHGKLRASAYIGGMRADVGEALAVTPDGSVYIVGRTSSQDFPAVNGYRTSLIGGIDAFLLKYLSPDLSTPSPSPDAEDK